MLDLTKDEKEMLDAYRRARAMGFADIAVSFEDGMIKKLWITEKKDPAKLKGLTQLREQAS